MSGLHSEGFQAGPCKLLTLTLILSRQGRGNFMCCAGVDGELTLKRLRFLNEAGA